MSKDPLEGTGRVRGLFRRFRTDRGPSGRYGTGRGTLGGGAGWVGGPSRRSGTGRGTIGEVRYRLGGHSQRTGMGRRTLPKVWDGSGDPPGGPRLVGGPYWLAGTGRGNLG